MDVFELQQFLGSDSSEGFQNFLDLFQNVYSHLTATEFMQCNGPIQVSMINEERHAKSKDGIPIMSFTAFHGR